MSDLNKNELPSPTLMRMARGTYAQAIGAELHALGFEDLPRNAVVILTGIDESEGARPEFPAELGVTKQAVSLVVDTLVNRGYLERRPATDDRRRIDLELTYRGEEVVAAAARAIDAINQHLQERVSHEQIDAARAVLIALTEIKTNSIGEGTGRRRTPRGLRRFSPIFRVHNLEAALTHYRSLGFDAFLDEDSGHYGFAHRDGVELHLALLAQNEPPSPAAAYLFVRDADALFREWSQPAIAGITRPVEVTPYGLREGSHVDPDGNLIRFGSPIEE